MDARMPCGELSSRLGEDEVLVLDCRAHEDWERCGLHIPGSLWMPFEQLLTDSMALPDDELIVVCGFAADGSDARRACRLLQQRGLLAVCLEGGLPQWLREGLPTENHFAHESVSQLC